MGLRGSLACSVPCDDECGPPLAGQSSGKGAPRPPAAALLGGRARTRRLHPVTRRELGDHTAVEAKGNENFGPRDLRSLEALAGERPIRRAACAGLERRPRRLGKVDVLPDRG